MLTKYEVEEEVKKKEFKSINFKRPTIQEIGNEFVIPLNTNLTARIMNSIFDTRIRGMLERGNRFIVEDNPLAFSKRIRVREGDTVAVYNIDNAYWDKFVEWNLDDIK